MNLRLDCDGVISYYFISLWQKREFWEKRENFEQKRKYFEGKNID